MFGSKLKSPIGFKNIVKLVSNAGAPDEVRMLIVAMTRKIVIGEVKVS